MFGDRRLKAIRKAGKCMCLASLIAAVNETEVIDKKVLKKCVGCGVGFFV